MAADTSPYISIRGGNQSTHFPDIYREIICLCFCSDRIVNMKFMRKYIHVAKDIKPTLTRPAADYISDEYSKLRNQDNLQSDNVARVRPLRMNFKRKCRLIC